MQAIRLNFVKDLARNIYGISIIALTAYGIQTGKPASIATVSTLLAATASRAITQRLMANPLKEQLQGLLAALNDAHEQNSVLSSGLERSFATGKFLQSDREQLQAKIEDQSRWFDEAKAELAEAIRKLRKAEEDNQEFQIEETKWKAQLATYRQPLEMEINRLKEACKHYQQQYQGSVNELNTAIENNAQLIAEVNLLRLQIQSMLQPRKLAEGLDTNNFSNTLVDWFQKADPAIVLDAESADVIDGNWVLVFILREKRDGNRAKELATAMMNDFSLPVVPSLKINGDRLTVTIYRGEQTNESKYLKVDPKWLKNALVFTKQGRIVTHHARFSGSTETGKSTLVSNAVGCIIQNIPLIEIELADPLTAGMSEWTTLTPKYKGEDACVAGLMEFYQEFKRLDQGLEKSDKPKVFILDEFDRMMQNHPELVPIVLDLWKSGRHQQRYLWVIGQSVLVGRFNLNQEDVQNVIGFYLGNTVERGLSDANDDPAYNVGLRQEWHYAKARGLKYVCLCRPMTVTGRPFLAVMPPGSTFAPGNMQAHSIAEQLQAESHLDGRLVEFDLDATRENLNRLLDNGSTEEPSPILGLTRKELGQAQALIAKGLSTSSIIYEIWKLKPNGRGEYPNRKKQIEHLRNQA